jgi:hypothetical protein
MSQAGYAAFTQLAYDRLKTNTLMIGGPYYEQSWTVMGLLMASGNYLNYVPTPTPTPTPDACQTRIKVNVGGAAQSGYSADKVWSAGSWGYLAAQAGAVGTSGGPVTGSPDPGLYLDERYGTDVRYRFSGLANGPATVTLQWAETYFNAAGQRQMDVSLNGVQVENNLDVYAAAGGKNKALNRSYAVTVSAGQIDLILTGVVDNASICAISVQAGPQCSPTASPTRTPAVSPTNTPTRSPTPSASPTFSASPTVSPTFSASATPDACAVIRRINAGGGAFTDGAGAAWAADQAYSAGSYGYVSFAAGTLGTSAGPIAGTADDALYMSERYGNAVRYRFDVPNGAYTVRVKLAETYFSTAGQRSLSLSANGTTVLNNVDLFTLAGGRNVAKDLTFGATAAGGQLYIEAWSGNNNGTVMAIELVGQQNCSPTITRTHTSGLSATRTITVTSTPSPSFTLSASPSPSPSGSASSTPVPATASPSATATPAPPSATVTPTRSPTAPAATATATSTVSGTSSPSPANTASSTVSVSRTRTPAPTATVTAQNTASITASFTAVPVGSSATVTPSISPTSSASATALPATATPSSSATALPATATPSSSATALPATATPSSSATVLPATATPSSSATVLPATATPSSSATAVPATFTPSATATAVPATVAPSASVTALPATATPSPSSTAAAATASSTAVMPATSTSTLTATATFTPTVTATVSGSPTLTALATAGGTMTPAPTDTAVAGADEPLSIEEHRAWPNPWQGGPGGVAVRLKGRAETLTLKVYSKALTGLGKRTLGPVGPGWVQLPWPDGFETGAANGIYFYEVTSDPKCPSGTGRLMVLH